MTVAEVDTQWQADSVTMQQFSKHNNGRMAHLKTYGHITDLL